jgi:dihydroorotate dehydrogenase (NAD+) catalytic subunit
MVQIPVIGLGGIERPEDVLDYIVVGAAAVQVGTAHFVDPRATWLLVGALENLCRKEKIHTIKSLRGTLGENSG